MRLPNQGPPFAPPRPWPYTPWVVGIATAVGTFATVSLLHRLSQAQRVEELPPYQPEPEPPYQPPQPQPPEDDLEDWEREAEQGGDVDPHAHPHSSEVPDPSQVVGEGHPSEHCHEVDEEALDNPDTGVICVTDPLDDPEYKPRQGAAPMAQATDTAIWPVGPDSKHKKRLVVSYWTDNGIRGKWGRYIGAPRGGRKHAGVDLFANVGDPVRAPDAGKVLAILPFSKGSWAVYLKMANDQVANLGEIAKKSWREFGIKPGMEVERGDNLARVALMHDGAHMLHYEMYDASGVSDEDLVKEIRQGKMRWTKGEPPPPRLLDPSAYLVNASSHSYRIEQPTT